MIELVSRALCLLILWPALLLTFRVPSPARQAIARQWGAIVPMRKRVIYIRFQFAVAPILSV
jgi:hypothetical protein